MSSSSPLPPGHPDTEAERRLVTVLFGDLVGYTSLSEARDPELVRECLNLCFDRLSQEAIRRGGYVDKIVGDEIMVLFGAPRAQEDDAGRAVEVGLAMQRALADLAPELERQLGVRLQIRIGVNTGLVVTGAVGPGGYTVTGDAVNIAARLEKAAEPDQVLVGETTRRMARRQFSWGERQQIQVKGRAGAVSCSLARELAASPLRLVPTPSDTPYVGRSALLQRLTAAWNRVSEGTVQVLQLVGESGIGKTRVVAHFFATVNVPPDHILYTRADTPPRTFGPMLELLSLMEKGGSYEIAAQPQAGRLEESASEMEPDWLVSRMLNLVSSLAGSGPVALVLDDMHRADRATVEVIERLLPRLRELPVLVLLLRQPVGRRTRAFPGAEAMTVHPLVRFEAQALIDVLAPGLSGGIRDEILDRTGGNPLYMELMTAPRLDAEPEISSSLQSAIVARVDELEASSRQLIREASIFGQTFHEEPLRLMTSVRDRFVEALEHLCDVGLIDHVPGRLPAYQFRHSLVQQVLHEGLLRSARRELHARAVDALQLSQEGGLEVDPSTLAYHLEEAGETARAAAFHLVAAERAEILRAPSEAKRHRRAANRLLSMTSIVDLYSGSTRPGPVARAGAVAIQLVLAVALVLPVFLLFSLRRPEQSSLTLGLPLEITELNLSSVALAAVLGGLPLLMAGVTYAHLAAPTLLRRRVRAWIFVASVSGGWILGFGAVVLGYGVLIGLLRISALDRLSSMYIGAATLRMMLGDYTLVLTSATGTFLTSLVWTVVLRLEGREAGRVMSSSLRPRQLEAIRRWNAMRQGALLLGGAALLCGVMLLTYQLRLLPHSDVQGGLPLPAFAVLISICVVLAATGAAAVLTIGQRLHREGGSRRLSMLGFEVPLISALLFGTIVWFGMRQAVIVTANDVDSPAQLSAYRHAASLFPDLAIAQYLLGERYLAHDDYDAALAHLDRAVELDSHFAASYLPRSRVLIEKGNLDGALADANKLIALKPNHPAGYAMRGWVESMQGEKDAEDHDFALATRAVPDGTEAWDVYFVRCLAFAAIDQTDAAETDCKRSLELNPRHYQSLNQLGLLTFEKGDYESSAIYWTKLIDIDPSNAITWTNRGISLEYLGRYEEARSDLIRALDINPGDPQALSHRAEVELYLDHPDDARAAADRAVSIDESFRCTRLFVSRYTNDTASVIDDATQLLTLQHEGKGCGPDTPDFLAYFLTARGLAYVQGGNRDAGLADLDGALAMDPTYAPGYDRRGYAHFLLGGADDLRRAASDFDQAGNLLSTLGSESRAELHYHRALLLREESNVSLASAEVNEALKDVQIPAVRKAIEDLRATLKAR